MSLLLLVHKMEVEGKENQFEKEKMVEIRCLLYLFYGHCVKNF